MTNKWNSPLRTRSNHFAITCKRQRKLVPTEGGCKFHGGELKSVGWDYKYTCCSKSSRNYDAARSLPGCTKGKHRSKHHTNYPYAAYYFYMAKQVTYCIVSFPRQHEKEWECDYKMSSDLHGLISRLYEEECVAWE